MKSQQQYDADQENNMANEKPLNPPNLDALVKAGTNAETAAKPSAEGKLGTIDLSSVGGKLIASPPTGSSKPVDLSSCYGETGRALDEQLG
jgi:hypothetical protein